MCQRTFLVSSLTRSLSAGILLLLAAAATQASVILDYDLSAVPNVAVTSVTATSVAAGLTATELTRGPGVVATNLTSGFSANDWATTTASRQEAIATGEYFQFGFTVAPGGSASLSQLEVALRRSATDAPMNYEWQYSLDAFATAGSTISVAGSPYYSTGNFTYFGRSSGSGGVAENFNYMTTSVAGQGNGNIMPPLDLTGISNLQNMTAGSTVTFRLYGWGEGLGASSNTVALGRNLGPRLSGVAVPEPASLVVVGSGLGVAMLGWLRRRSRIAAAA